MIEFFVTCIPPKSTQQHNVRIFRGKTGKAFIGKSKTNKAAQAQQHLAALLSPHAPEKPLDGPLSMTVTWSYPWRKSEPKKNRIAGARPCDTRPDVDNLTKGLCDTMTRCGFWNDDSQIAELTFRKNWADRPGIQIAISKL